MRRAGIGFLHYRGIVNRASMPSPFPGFSSVIYSWVMPLSRFCHAKMINGRLVLINSALLNSLLSH